MDSFSWILGGQVKFPAMTVRTKRVYSLSLTLASLFVVGCSPQVQSPPLRLLGDSAKIISTRPQSAPTGLFMVKLNSPPVLAKLNNVDGHKQIDPDRLKAVTDEQTELEAKLKALSPDVHILFRYRMVLNALAVVAPTALESQIRGMSNVLFIEASGQFGRPVLPKADGPDGSPSPSDLAAHNSVKFIGALDAHARGIRGQGMKIGILDTGIDYTHAMFGGTGTEEAYKAVDPSQPNAGFPNAKVVGGIDLVGTEFNAASADFNKRFPTPDENPIDEAGHGSHVAGTVAGIGDGVHTYTGVAPDAKLYAIKVFGKSGSTSDVAVIAGLEYSVDPQGKGDLSGQLDVVNLSLGSQYGDGHILYAEAIGNLSRAGTVVVCSAGNEGDTEYIVGAPSVAADAFSIAATRDDQDSNYKFAAVSFETSSGGSILAEMLEASKSKPIEKAGDVTGPIVYAGLADKDFSDELKAQINGKIAFIDRGAVEFEKKVKRAKEAGAIGVVVANNKTGKDDDVIQMALENEYDIPAVMVKKSVGDQLKNALASGDVVMHFKTDQKIEKTELIDTIASFSSKGPRSYDALIKPEISAPGSQTISAEMGKGDKGVAMSGTSMAAPHMAGVMALLKQSHPTLSSDELKALAMGTSKTLVDETKAVYPVSRQGAGRIQVMSALDAKLLALPSSLSLGEVTLEARKVIQKVITYKNLTETDLTLTLSFDGSPSIRMTGESEIALKSGEERAVTLRFTLDATALTQNSNELDGWVKASIDGREMNRVPVLAVANKVAQVHGEKLVIRSTSDADSQGAVVDLDLKNSGVNSGDVYLFNLIALDRRKQDSSRDVFRTRACDLQGAGYRVIRKDGKSVLQVAAKLYEPMTSWASCEISVLIDGDGDRDADQELVGTLASHLPGLTSQTGFVSILLDAKKAKDIRRQFELDTVNKKPDVKEDYSKAIVGLSEMSAISHSTIAVIEADVSDLMVRPTGELSVRIAASSGEETAIEADDYLVKDNSTWLPLNVGDDGAGFTQLPERISLARGESQTIALTKGAGSEALWLLMPQNRTVVGGIATDAQSQQMVPIFDTILPLRSVASP